MPDAKSAVPEALRAEHQALHEHLVRITEEPGAVGEAAHEVARLLHPHFAREEQFALAPLALLARLAAGPVTPDMASVLSMTQRLKEALPQMLAEHAAILRALERLRSAARAAGRPEHERFAETLALHAQMEEQVLYPAAILVGEYVAKGI